MRSRDKPSQQRPHETTQIPANISSVLITTSKTSQALLTVAKPLRIITGS